MAVFFNGRAIFSILAITALAGCEGTDLSSVFSGNGSGATPTDQTAPSAGPRPEGSVRVVEAPEIFDVSETGLWDGRPSLGGVWVAHPDVTEPERVIIRNESNSKFVIGALFRRERENPGPRIQVSSDAATELGVLAGAHPPACSSPSSSRRC